MTFSKNISTDLLLPKVYKTKVIINLLNSYYIFRELTRDILVGICSQKTFKQLPTQELTGGSVVSFQPFLYTNFPPSRHRTESSGYKSRIRRKI